MAGTKKMGHQPLLVKKASNISHGSVVTHFMMTFPILI